MLLHHLYFHKRKYHCCHHKKSFAQSVYKPDKIPARHCRTYRVKSFTSDDTDKQVRVGNEKTVSHSL